MDNLIENTGEDFEYEVPKLIESRLMEVMKTQAFKNCNKQAKAYADCCSGRTFTMIWKCRPTLSFLNECLHEHTTRENLRELKRAWHQDPNIVYSSEAQIELGKKMRAEAIARKKTAAEQEQKD